MAFFDISGQDLQSYQSEVKKPADFQDFWNRTLAQARDWDLGVHYAPVQTGLSRVTFYDVSFTGFGGQRIKGWYGLPISSDPLGNPVDDPSSLSYPVVVQFIGYGGGRGMPLDWLMWPVAGYATLIMDTRGQGSSWRTGDTPDGGQRPDSADGPQIPGFMTRGVSSPETSYFTRVYVDAARAVEAAAEAPGANPKKIILTGGSQGGALTLAAAALSSPGIFDKESVARGWQLPDYQVIAAMPDVPFLCDIQRAVGLVDSDPYNEVVRYLKSHRDKIDRVFRTFSYLDGITMASFAKMPALFSVALMDTICPPSTVYGAYNRWLGTKRIEQYPYNNHEGGQTHHQVKQISFIKDLL